LKIKKNWLIIIKLNHLNKMTYSNKKYKQINRTTKKFNKNLIILKIFKIISI